MTATFSGPRRVLLIATLFLVSVLSYADRNVLAVVIEAVKEEYRLSDTMVGLLLGAPFAVLFAIAGVPIAHLADRHNRKTILIVCLLVWSAATVLCGLSSAVWMLAAARLLVGAGEAGTSPTSHSLVADYCPPDQRSRAYAALTASAAIGGFLALSGGGLIAGSFGWRATFLAMGALCLPVAILAALILVEPRATRSAKRPAAVRPEQGLREQLRALGTKRSYVLLVSGITTYGFVAYGPLLLAPAYLIRVLHIDVARAGLMFGPALGIGTLIGSLVGGLLGDYLSRQDVRWLVRVPAIGLAIALPLGLIAFSSASVVVFVAACGALVATLSACLPVIFSAVQRVCGSQRRALATAVLFGALNMVGMSGGPLLTGWLSDLFGRVEGVLGLRSAMVVVLFLLVPASGMMIAAGRYLAPEIDD